MNDNEMSNHNHLLKMYLKECGDHQLLNQEDEKKLATQYKNGDTSAGQKLLLANTKLIVKAATDYCTNWDNIMDLIQEGNMGFMIGIQKFDLERGYRLTTYALWWAKAFIWRYVMNNWRIIKIGNRVQERKLFYRLEKERQALVSSGIEPSHSLIAKKLNMNENEVAHLSTYLSHAELSIDLPATDHDAYSRYGHRSLQEMIADGEQVVDSMADRQHFINKFRAIIDKMRPSLKPKELVVLDKRLLAEVPQTLQQIGESISVTRERVRQIENTLIKKIRRRFQKRKDMIEAVQEDF